MFLEILQDPEVPVVVDELGKQLNTYLILGLGAVASGIMSVLKKVVPKFDAFISREPCSTQVRYASQDWRTAIC